MTTKLTLREAAEAVGMSKPGLLKAIKSGKVSAEKDLNGQYQIQPVELFRVYSPAKTVNGNGDLDHANGAAQMVGATEDDSVNYMELVNAGLREKITLLDRRLADKDDVILDLRRRLDQATEECNRLSLVLTSQLPAPQPARKGWWARLLGGG